MHSCTWCVVQTFHTTTCDQMLSSKSLRLLSSSRLHLTESLGADMQTPHRKVDLLAGRQEYCLKIPPKLMLSYWWRLFPEMILATPALVLHLFADDMFCPTERETLHHIFTQYLPFCSRTDIVTWCNGMKRSTFPPTGRLAKRHKAAVPNEVLYSIYTSVQHTLDTTWQSPEQGLAKWLAFNPQSCTAAELRHHLRINWC